MTYSIRTARRSMIAAATTCAVLSGLPAAATAAGTQTIDKTVTTKCFLDPRPAVFPRAEFPLDIRVRATTDAWAPTGSDVSLSNVAVSLVATGDTKAALRAAGATSLSLQLYTFALINSTQSTLATWSELIAPNTLAGGTVSDLTGSTSSEIPLSGSNVSSTLGPFRLLPSSEQTPSSVEFWQLSANASISSTSNEQYDVVCGFGLDGDTRIALYPNTGPVESVLPAITAVNGRGIPNVGGVAVVLGDRLKGTTAVTVGGKRAAFRQVGPNRLVVVAPPLPRGTYPVVVTTAAGSSPAAAAATLRY